MRQRWAAGGALIAASLVVLSGLASASSPPFKGKTDYYDSSFINGCQTVKVPVKPHLDLRTGDATLDALVTARNCGASLGQAFYSEAWETYIPSAVISFHPGTGPKAVIVGSTDRETLNATIVPGSVSLASCESSNVSYVDPANGSYDYNYSLGDCGVSASALVVAQPIVFDATNDTYLYGTDALVDSISASESFDVYWGCYGPGWGYYASSGGCFSNNVTLTSPTNSVSLSHHGSSRAFVNDTFVRGHTYYLLWQVTAQLIAYVAADPGATARVSVDFGSPGLGIDLNSVKTA